MPPFGRERAGGRVLALVTQTKENTLKQGQFTITDFAKVKNPERSPVPSPLNQPDMLHGLSLQFALTLQPRNIRDCFEHMNRFF